MAESNKLMVDERDRRHRPWKRWLVWCWPMLRVLLQTGAAGAMLSQHEGLALMIGGVAMVLEKVPNHLTRRRGARVGTRLSPARAGSAEPVEGQVTKNVF